MRAGCRKFGVLVLGAVVFLTAHRAMIAQQGAPGLPQRPGVPRVVETTTPPLIPLPATPALPGSKEATPAPKEAPVATKPAEPEVAVEQIVVSEKDGQNPANPTGRQEPGIALEWMYPAMSRLGQPVTCTLVVKSLSTNRLHQVAVRTRIPAGISVQATEPKGTTEGDLVVWQLGTLEPRQEKRLDIQMIPHAKGSLPCHAFVTFTGSATARLEVREPRLTIKAAAPGRVITGDMAMFALTVSNPGDARSDHVKVRVNLTEGLEYGNTHATEFNLDSLGPNESRTVLVQCLAKNAGPQTLSAVATAAFGLQAKTDSDIQVLMPRLDLAVTAPKMRYLDRHAVFHFKVANTGTAVANHVTVTNQIPKGFQMVSTGGGHHDFSTGIVMWFLGDLEPGQNKEVVLDLLAVNPGEHHNLVTVTAARGLRTSADVMTRLEGLPGLQIELVDVEDPIEVGKDVSYEIRVTNTGTRTETNLQLSCTLPEKAEYRAAKCIAAGITHQVKGREVIFAPIPRLTPRADVIYRVTARGLAPGDLRFQARVRADGLETPVLREESTRVFGDEREVISTPNRK